MKLFEINKALVTYIVYDIIYVYKLCCQVFMLSYETIFRIPICSSHRKYRKIASKRKSFRLLGLLVFFVAIHYTTNFFLIVKRKSQSKKVVLFISVDAESFFTSIEATLMGLQLLTAEEGITARACLLSLLPEHFIN